MSNNPNELSWTGAIIIVVTILGLIIGIVQCVSPSKSKQEDTDSYGHTKSDVQLIAKSEIRDRLKAPSTAEFEWSPTTKRLGNSWTVSGYVDAQNSFGAMIRSNYSIKITFSGKDDYKVDFCDIK